MSSSQSQASLSALADRWLPKLVLSPTLLISLVFVYGFIAWTGWLSLTESRLLPQMDLAGLIQYQAGEIHLWQQARLGQRQPAGPGDKAVNEHQADQQGGRQHQLGQPAVCQRREAGL